MTKKRQMLRVPHLFMLLISLLFIAGCGSKGVYYAALKDAPAVTSGRIAVISGDADDVGKNLAQEVTSRLQQRTNFKVLSQDEITKKLGKYPFDVKVAILEGGVPSSWLPTDEQKKINKLQTKLDVDYLLILWNRNLNKQVYYSNNGSSEYYTMSVFGNLLQYPAGKAVGYTDFSYRRPVRFWEAFRRSSYFVNSLIQISAKGITGELSKLAQAEK